jgi:hypothetical protein
MIIPDGADRDSVSRSLPGLEIQVQLEEPLPIGEYEVQVIVTGPEGPSQFASARLRVSEAC